MNEKHKTSTSWRGDFYHSILIVWVTHLKLLESVFVVSIDDKSRRTSLGRVNKKTPHPQKSNGVDKDKLFSNRS